MDHLNAKKTSLNVKKTEPVLFKQHKNKKLAKDKDRSKSVNYLGVNFDKNLNWKDQTHDIPKKLNRANTLLYNIRNFSL